MTALFQAAAGPSAGNVAALNNSFQFAQGALSGTGSNLSSLTPIGAAMQQQANYLALQQQHNQVGLAGVLGGNVALDPLMHLNKRVGGGHNFGTHHRNPQHQQPPKNTALHLSQALSP